MKKYFNNNLSILKERNIEFKNTLLFNGICLLIISLISLISILGFKEYGVTTLYLLPIYLLAMSIYLLYVTNKEKNTLVNKEFYFNIIGGILLLFNIFYLFLNPVVNTNYFSIIIGSLLILKSIFNIFKYNKHSILEYIYLGITIIVGILFIIFNTLISKLFIYLILLFILVSIFKIILLVILNKQK